MRPEGYYVYKIIVQAMGLKVRRTEANNEYEIRCTREGSNRKKSFISYLIYSFYEKD